MNTTITSITQIQDELKLLVEPKDYSNLDAVKDLANKAEQLRAAMVTFRESVAEIDKDQVSEGIEQVFAFILKIYGQAQSVADMDIVTNQAALIKAQEEAEKAPAEQRLEISQIVERAKQALEAAKSRAATIKSLSDAPKQKFSEFKEEQKHDYINYILLPTIHDAGNLINSDKLKMSLEQIVKNYGKKLAKDSSAGSSVAKLNPGEVNIFINPAIAENDNLKAFMGSIKNNLEGECSDEGRREFVQLLGILGFHLAKAIVTRSEKLGRFILAYKAVDSVITATGFNENALASFAPRTADPNKPSLIDGGSIVVLDAARSISDLIIFLVNNGNPNAASIANIMQAKSKKPYNEIMFEDHSGYGTINTEFFERLTYRTNPKSAIMRAREGWRLFAIIAATFFILGSCRHIWAYEKFKAYQANLKESPAPAPLRRSVFKEGEDQHAQGTAFEVSPLKSQSSSLAQIGGPVSHIDELKNEVPRYAPENRKQLNCYIFATLVVVIFLFLFLIPLLLYYALLLMNLFHGFFFWGFLLLALIVGIALDLRILYS